APFIDAKSYSGRRSLSLCRFALFIELSLAPRRSTALMTRTVSFRSVWATTRTCPRVDAPIVRKRASASECASSANVVDSGSSRTVAASWKLTRCLLRFAAAFAGSHSNCTARVYGPVPADHQTAERIGNELQAAALMESANRRDRSAAPRLA